jgi:hypothetical protein
VLIFNGCSIMLYRSMKSYTTTEQLVDNREIYSEGFIYPCHHKAFVFFLAN